MLARIAVWAALAAVLAVPEGPRARPARAPLVTQARADTAQVLAQRETTGVFILARTIVPHLPPAPLIWRLETFPSEDAARAAGSPASVVVKAYGKTWLFTVAGQHAAASGGGVRVAAVDLPPVPQAQSYELLAALAILQPGDDVGVHTHPGPEAWYVLAGEQCLETAVGLSRAHTGQTMVAPAATPMKLVITGSSLRRAVFLVLHDAGPPRMGGATWG